MPSTIIFDNMQSFGKHKLKTPSWLMSIPQQNLRFLKTCNLEVVNNPCICLWLGCVNRTFNGNLHSLSLSSYIQIVRHGTIDWMVSFCSAILYNSGMLQPSIYYYTALFEMGHKQSLGNDALLTALVECSDQ